MRHLLLDAAAPPSGFEPPSPLLGTVGADRRRCGPYAAAGALAELLVPLAPSGLVAAHDIEIRAVAPDLHGLVPARRQSIAAGIARSERILVPAPQRTRRIANGFAEFVRDAVTGPLVLVVEQLDEADPADLELVEVLMRRLDPQRLTIVACATRPEIQRALSPYSRTAQHTGEPREPRRDQPTGIRARLGLDLAGTPAYRFAVEWALENGCHHAVAELGARGLLLADPSAEPDDWWTLVHHTAIALGALEREEEAEQVLTEARQRTTDPVRHSTMAYTSAMLRTRHHDRARRNLGEALAQINVAIALCGLLPDPVNRALKLGFDLNGKALIETRRGNLGEALRLVQAALDLAEADLDPAAQPVHRLVLRANRAQLLAMTGDREAALRDLDAVIAADPQYPDYYVDRGNLLARLGRDAEATADYESAMRVDLPFPEPYFNRSQLRFRDGDHEGALADLDYALELDPEFLDALVNRSGLLVARGEHDRARADVDTGLRLSPGNPYLLCALGQISDGEAAMRAFDAALAQAPALAVAWANRGVAAYETGDLPGAISDLSEAIALGEQPELLFNRAIALRDSGRESEARADLLRALELRPDDSDIRLALVV
ncbi:MAG: tetratricopeptide repeat protein [Streptosporangiaceae bacterium]